MTLAVGPAAVESARVPVLSVEDLVVEFSAAGRRSMGGKTVQNDGAVVNGVCFAIGPGEILGLIGASGAGKTMTALALLGLLPAGGRVTSGRVVWRGRDLLTLPEPALRAVRGSEIGMMFQDPVAALHPLQRVDAQVAEAIRVHAPSTSRRDAHARATELLCRLGVPIDRVRNAPYPHQWSGGMCQRAMLAMAMVNGPALLIADEPTTALDAITQAQVLRLLNELRQESAIAMLLVTHDLSVVAALADRVAVMDAGEVIELGTVDAILGHPSHAGTRRLVDRTPSPTPRTAHSATATDLLVAHGIEVTYGTGNAKVRAVRGVSLCIAAGETLGLVGESGAGKSSLARALVRLTPLAGGRIVLDGQELTALHGMALRRARRGLQIVFQNSYASLNPRRTVAETIAEPLHIHREFGADGANRVRRVLNAVELDVALLERFPRQLSGGERQRVALARALVLSPRVLVLDEAVSSLDVPTRESILALLLTLQEQQGLAFLLISHDLEVVCRVAHRVAVMHQGSVVEMAAVSEIRDRPMHPYTRDLIAAGPGRNYRSAPGSSTT